MSGNALTEIEAAHFLGCKRLAEARRVLNSIPPAVLLKDGPRWTEAQLRRILGEQIDQNDPEAAESRLLRKAEGMRAQA